MQVISKVRTRSLNLRTQVSIFHLSLLLTLRRTGNLTKTERERDQQIKDPWRRGRHHLNCGAHASWAREGGWKGRTRTSQRFLRHDGGGRFRNIETLNNQKLQRVKEQPFLGITLDQSYTEVAQTNRMRVSVVGPFNSIRKLTSTR